MKCPYTDKLGACVYLEEMTEGDRKYECPTCPHYRPMAYMKSADEYYNDPERESWAILIIGVSLMILALAILSYLGLKLFQLIKGCLI